MWSKTLGTNCMSSVKLFIDWVQECQSDWTVSASFYFVHVWNKHQMMTMKGQWVCRLRCKLSKKTIRATNYRQTNTRTWLNTSGQILLADRSHRAHILAYCLCMNHCLQEEAIWAACSHEYERKRSSLSSHVTAGEIPQSCLT